MSMLSKDQIKEMIQRYDIKTTEDIKNVFKDMFGEAVQEFMEVELDTHLGYEKHSKENTDTMNENEKNIVKILRKVLTVFFVRLFNRLHDNLSG